MDVRDVAQAFVRALSLTETSDTNPRRFLIVSDAQMPTMDLEAPLQQLFPEYKINGVNRNGPLSRLLIQVPGIWRAVTTEFRRAMFFQRFVVDNGRSKTELGLTYRPLEESLRDSVTSMVDTGYIKPRLK